MIRVQRTAKGASGKGSLQKTSKNRQKVSKIFSTLFDIFSRRAKNNVKNRQKVSKIFSTFFDNFRAAPVFRPLFECLSITATGFLFLVFRSSLGAECLTPIVLVFAPVELPPLVSSLFWNSFDFMCHKIDEAVRVRV